MRSVFAIVLLSFLFVQCSNANQKSAESQVEKPTPRELQKLETAYFASGCFWCVEAIYESVIGVEEVISGYAGGKKPNPTYEKTNGRDNTHAESVEVYYDPEVVSFETLVKVYYGSQDPTTVNGQRPDYGIQYRSIIFYKNEEQKKIAMDYRDSLDNSGQYNKPIATEFLPFEKFWKGEAYHQDYERRNPNQSYIRNVSIPRLKRFQAKFPELIKKGK